MSASLIAGRLKKNLQCGALLFQWAEAVPQPMGEGRVDNKNELERLGPGDLPKRRGLCMP